MGERHGSFWYPGKDTVWRKLDFVENRPGKVWCITGKHPNCDEKLLPMDDEVFTTIDNVWEWDRDEVLERNRKLKKQYANT